MSSTPHRRRGKIAAGSLALAASVVAANVAAFAGLQQVFPWMTVFPQETTRAETTPPSPARDRAQAASLAVPDGVLPAQVVVDQVMKTVPAALDQARWAATARPEGVPGTAFTFACGAPAGPGPVVAASRGWAQASGPLPQQMRAGVTVSARAYSAGAGAVAFAALRSNASLCAAATLTTAPAAGVESTGVYTAGSTSVLWRRGDVVMVAAAKSGTGPGAMSSLTGVVAEFDAALDAALNGLCLNQESSVAGGTRSPFVDRDAYTGLLKTETVTWTPEADEVTAEEQVEAAGKVPVAAIPAVEAPLPYLAVLPTRPADPVYPAALPTPVDRPVVPVAPVSPRRTQQVGRAVEDAQGPGCGWAFTGQVAPDFDAAAAAEDFTQARQDARTALRQGWENWQGAKVRFYTAYDRYLQQVAAYRGYVAEVEEVRAAWAQIQADRDAYATAVAAYEAAVAAYEQWRADRKAARTEYRAAKQACQALPEPTPTEPTSPVDPTVPEDPDGPATPADPTPAPGTAAEIPTTTGPGQVCPPVRPEILDEEPPTVPVEPVPPVDPRPGTDQDGRD